MSNAEQFFHIPQAPPGVIRIVNNSPQIKFLFGSNNLQCLGSVRLIKSIPGMKLLPRLEETILYLSVNVGKDYIRMIFRVYIDDIEIQAFFTGIDNP